MLRNGEVERFELWRKERDLQLRLRKGKYKITRPIYTRLSVDVKRSNGHTPATLARVIVLSYSIGEDARIKTFTNRPNAPSRSDESPMNVL